MMRKPIFTAVALSTLFIFSGCASKTATDAINSPPTATTANEASELSSTSVPSEQVSAPSSATLSTLNGRALETVYFEYDAFTIKPGARQVLERNAAWLNANPSIKITIEGHCDERGSDEYNLALGDRRAIAVKYYFVNLGIAAERLITISYGEERPAVDGQDETAWSKNRRVEFK